MSLELKTLDRAFSICKLPELSSFDLTREFFFMGKTDEELSLVCETARVPSTVTEREDGWRAFRIEGVLDFSLIGILAEISRILAEAKIGIFVVSTFNTDYVLVKADVFERALSELETAGYEVGKEA